MPFMVSLFATYFDAYINTKLMVVQFIKQSCLIELCALAQTNRGGAYYLHTKEIFSQIFSYSLIVFKTLYFSE